MACIIEGVNGEPILQSKQKSDPLQSHPAEVAVAGWFRKHRDLSFMEPHKEYRQKAVYYVVVILGKSFDYISSSTLKLFYERSSPEHE
jgi:hypothetical protein